MVWSTFITALGLLCVFEGLLPSMSPRLWRKLMHQMLIQSDRTLHIIGLISMLIGLALVSVARDLY